MAAMAALMIIDRTCQGSACSHCEVDRPCTIEFFSSMICSTAPGEHSLLRETMIVLFTVVRIGTQQHLRTKDQRE
jgi:hypothetical protein